MPTVIKHWSGRTIHQSDKPTIAEALTEARTAGADLRGADLRGAVLIDANLSGADLRGAVLRGADLSDADLSGAVLIDADLRDAVLIDAVLIDADLRGADLRGAVLSGAVLRDAVLRDAVLRGADLRGADLRGAVLRDAVLSDADLRDAVLRGADLSDADLSGADLSGAVGFTAESVTGKATEVPVISRIHRTVLAAATAEGCRLDMRQWHTCETTHCRAGWIVHLAGESGRALEQRIGTPAAATRIYLASDPGYADRSVRLPRWYCDDATAMADMRACAEREAAAEAAAGT